MILEIKVPAVGESITEGVLARWLKQDGEMVGADDALFELETDKVNTEVPAEAAGRLKCLVMKGATVTVGSVVATIDTAAAPAAKAAPAPAAVVPQKPRPASPLAGKVAQDVGVDVGGVEGSGPGGRVMKKDVLAAVVAPKIAAPPPPPPPAGDRSTTREPMSQLRRKIAERLVYSQQSTATLTTFNEADMSAIIALRSRYKESFKERHGTGLGFMSFFVKAVIEGLKAFPRVNAMIDGNDIVYNNFFDIGVAVSTDKGLVVPVIRDADHLSFAQVEGQVADYAAKAREGRLTLEDLQGGTFTVTNGGVFGSLMATPILNPPQVGILGMHKIMDRPVAVDGAVVIRPMMYMAFSYDHRIIDGRESVGFLVRVKECIEAPERLMLGV